jgi:hypothetical protein
MKDGRRVLIKLSALAKYRERWKNVMASALYESCDSGTFANHRAAESFFSVCAYDWYRRRALNVFWEAVVLRA